MAASRMVRPGDGQYVLAQPASEKSHRTSQEWFTLSEAYDLMVIHPRSRYESGRPTWLTMGGRRRLHAVKTDARPSEGRSYLAQAFYREELRAEAVPIDQMEYAADESPPTLLLPPGEFHIRIVDEDGTTVDEYSTEWRRSD